MKGISGMKTKSILIGLAGLMATALVAAEVQNHATAATNDQNAQTVVDAQGNLRVPEDYRTAYQFWGRGQSPLTKARVRNRSTLSMRRQARSPLTAKMGISLTARYC